MNDFSGLFGRFKIGIPKETIHISISRTVIIECYCIVDCHAEFDVS